MIEGKNFCKNKRLFLIFFLLIFYQGALKSQEFSDPSFPIVADGLRVQLFAKEPLVRNPCAITFDHRGRLTVGMGPQYRSPTPQTPGDSVYIFEDSDQNGEADLKIEFAAGLNNIQGLLWDRDKLYIANAPDFTVVQDTNNDGIGDLYTKLFFDLGNLEHGLHGLNWGPDGYLYMSKGNSKGLTQPPHRIAPKPFRKLWGVRVTGLPEFPAPQSFSATEYMRDFHDPSDDWGRQGGILRCLPDGSQLEIFSAGNRNPWDIAYDSSFNWLGTDNDQNLGDKIFSPFYGAHFGWGHEWSSDWVGEKHLPTVPPNGPLFEGSGTGVTWWQDQNSPEKYRGVFLINDWLSREVLVYKPAWDGARMKPSQVPLEILATAGRGRDMSRSDGRSFDPVDIEIGPDGAIYISSWGREYGAVFKNNKLANEGRIYKLTHINHSKTDFLPSSKFSSLSDEQLVLQISKEQTQIRLRLIQQELVERIQNGRFKVSEVFDFNLPNKTKTWLIHSASIANQSDFLKGLLDPTMLDGGIRQEVLVQVIKSLRKSDFIQSKAFFENIIDNPISKRVSHEIIIGIHRYRLPWKQFLTDVLSKESDRHIYYSAWRALAEVCTQNQLVQFTKSPNAKIRLGALLGMLEENKAEEEVVSDLTNDKDPAVAKIARKWMVGKDAFVIKGKPLITELRANIDDQNARKNRSLMFDGIPEITSWQSKGANSWGIVKEGEKTYTDRPYSLRQIPKHFLGMLVLRTSNQDDRNDDFSLSIKLNKKASLYVCHDKRIPFEYKPSWLDDFEKMDQTISNGDSLFQIYRMEVIPGETTLGANSKGFSHLKFPHAQYFVIVDIPDLTIQDEKSGSNVEEALHLLANADKHRGRELFFNGNKAACAKCHQLEGIGNAFAPDLENIGQRVDARFVIQSIIDPDAFVTEGFHQCVIETGEGNVYSGILLSESGRSLQMALLNGDVVSVPTREISSRSVLDVSGMPSYFKAMLSSRDVADITAYLLSESQQKVQTIDRGEWRVEQSDNQLDLFYQNRFIATYQIEHPKLTRPALVNVHTLSGEPVTRKFPAGEDADHQFMHPGLAVSFGWISGNDFWRLKAPVSHIGFIKNPTVQDGILEFSVKNEFLTQDQKTTVCFEIAEYKFKPLDDGQLHIAWNSKFYNDQKAFTFGDQEESGLAFRIADDLNVDSGNGRILNDQGLKNGSQTWGKQFSWIEYSGLRNNKRIGILIEPRDSNRRKCWSHSRDYGVLVANPFPRQSREQRPPLNPTIIPQKAVYDLSYELIIFETSPGQNGKDFLN